MYIDERRKIYEDRLRDVDQLSQKDSTQKTYAGILAVAGCLIFLAGTFGHEGMTATLGLGGCIVGGIWLWELRGRSTRQFEERESIRAAIKSIERGAAPREQSPPKH